MMGGVLILGIIVFGMLVGGAAQAVLGRSGSNIDWAMALVAGLAGSLVGGLIANLIAGEGLDLAWSGMIGSFIGAIIVSVIWMKVAKPKMRT